MSPQPNPAGAVINASSHYAPGIVSKTKSLLPLSRPTVYISATTRKAPLSYTHKPASLRGDHYAISLDADSFGALLGRGCRTRSIMTSALNPSAFVYSRRPIGPVTGFLAATLMRTTQGRRYSAEHPIRRVRISRTQVSRNFCRTGRYVVASLRSAF